MTKTILHRLRLFFPALAALAFPLGATANDIEPSKEFYTAKPADNPIVVDGDLGEWGSANILADPRFSIPKGSGDDGELVNFELHNGGNWNGPDDHTSNVRVVYDEENVYFGFVVTDEYHENSANSAWNGDSVQLMVANGDRNEIIALYNYALGGVEDDLGEVIVMHERGPAQDNPDFETTAVVTRDTENKRTTYEIKLPKGSMGLETLEGGVQFGLGMAINDGDEDTPGQRGWGGLGAHSIVFGKSPEETALVTMQAPPKRIQTNDIESGKEWYTGIKTTTDIVLDGDLSEWGAAQLLADPRFSIPKGSKAEGELVNFELHNGGNWNGPDDHTSNVRVIYDDDNVYFGFIVTDEYHENSANSAWNGDSVQLMVANGDRNEIIALYNYALGGVEGDLGDVIVMHERGPALENAGDPNFETSAVITRDAENKRTIYEIKLPKASMGLDTLDAGVQFGLGMAINDGDEDTPGQRGWGGLGAHSIVFGKSPEETARVTLAKANDIEAGKEFYNAGLPLDNGLITLDGELSEVAWQELSILSDPRFAIPKGSTSRGGGDLVLFELHNGGSWDGPDDHTSAVQVAWDEDNVYFAFVVTDEYHENSANSAWNGDSVQLMIANASQDEQIALYNYALGGIETEPGDVIVMHEAGPGQEEAFATEAVVKRNTETKRTTYEIRLPKGSLGLETLESGTQFGLGMAINDGDEATPGQRGWGGLGAHSIVFGKTPQETALVTLGASGGGGDSSVFVSALKSPTPESPNTFTFRGNDFGNSTHEPSKTVFLIDGEPVGNLEIIPATLGATDYVYTLEREYPDGSEHTAAVELYDAGGTLLFSETITWIQPIWAKLTADKQVRRVDTTKPGFLWRVFQNETYLPANVTEAEAALRGELVDPDGEPVAENFADESIEGAAEGPGYIVGGADLVEFEIPGVINLNAVEDGAAGQFPDDELMPGVPGLNGSADGASVEIITYVEFPVAGEIKLGVNSDDGYLMELGPFDNPTLMGDFPFPRGSFENPFVVTVVDPGIYPIRVVYFNRGGGATIELYHFEGDERILFNDIENGGLRTYRAAPEEFVITDFVKEADGDISLTWQSKAGRYYAVDTSTDLIEWDTIVTEIPEGGALADSMSYTDTEAPADAAELYYRVRQVPAPAYLSTDFENGPEGWEAFVDAGDTSFELGTPTAEGVPGAASGENAWGTNLAGNYGPGTVTRLRSPVVDVSGDNSPKIAFNYFNDSTLDVEGTVVQFLDENGDLLASLNDPEDIFTGQTEGWVSTTIRFPGAARGGKVIVEFMFLSDGDDEVGAGFYIDDVRID